MRGRWIVVAMVALALCGVMSGARAAEQPSGWKVLLIAGDDEEPAFDNAVDALAQDLAKFGLPSSSVTVLKASAQGTTRATRGNIQAAFNALRPLRDEGCFVFITTHGSPDLGLVITSAQAYVGPDSLEGLIDRSCRNHPTVLITSGCYSGVFADGPPLPADDRVILTAARPDRPSFGCNAHLQYTFFDKCILQSIAPGILWRDVMDRTRSCVSGNEFDQHVDAPSEPQLFIGKDVADLRVFGH